MITTRNMASKRHQMLYERHRRMLLLCNIDYISSSSLERVDDIDTACRAPEMNGLQPIPQLRPLEACSKTLMRTHAFPIGTGADLEQ